ncbi:MAG: NYN domain-containing protein [Candidatus Velamenicoccus archaeovorus]
MSLFYIVDGYNVIKRSGPFCDLPLRQARERFFMFLESSRPHGSVRNRLAVVFDGSAQVFGFKESRTFEIIFTTGESADEKIKEMVRADRDPRNIVVVTDDRELGYAVRCQGARVMVCADFLKSSGTAKRRGRSVAQEADLKNVLNIVQREKITQELKGLWLKEP